MGRAGASGWPYAFRDAQSARRFGVPLVCTLLTYPLTNIQFSVLLHISSCIGLTLTHIQHSATMT